MATTLTINGEAKSFDAPADMHARIRNAGIRKPAGHPRFGFGLGAAGNAASGMTGKIGEFNDKAREA